jgi:prevent-host-death family protein
MKTMDASKLRRSFARVLESVRDKKEGVVIVRYGRPVAALVPVGHLPSAERNQLTDRAAGPPSRRD